MTGIQLIFLGNAIVTVVAGFLMVRSRKLIHAALWLVLALLGVAVVFGILEAGFFAIVQVLVYVGAIAILIIFSIMLTRQSIEDPCDTSSIKCIITGVIMLLFLGAILFALLTWPASNNLTTPLTLDQQNIALLGKALVDPQGYVIPFEVTSILLLAALVGSIFVSFERKGEKE